MKLIQTYSNHGGIIIRCFLYRGYIYDKDTFETSLTLGSKRPKPQSAFFNIMEKNGFYRTIPKHQLEAMKLKLNQKYYR